MNEPSSSLLLVKNTDFSSSSLHFSTNNTTTAAVSANSKSNRISLAEISKTTTTTTTVIDDLDIQLEMQHHEQLNENYFNTRFKVNQNESSLEKINNNVSVSLDPQLSNVEKIDKQQKHKKNIQVINN